MDLMPPAVSLEAVSTNGERTKRRNVEISGDAEEEMQRQFRNMLRDNKPMQSLIKLCLSCSQKLRALMAVLYLVFKMPIDHKVVSYMSEETRKYSNACKTLKSQGKDQDEIKSLTGLPHVWAFNGLLKLMVETMGDRGRLVAEAAKSWNWKGINRVVKIAKVENMFGGKNKRVILCAPLANALIEELEAGSQEFPKEVQKIQVIHAYALCVEMLRKDPRITEMEGQAPSGDLERQLQAVLDEE